MSRPSTEAGVASSATAAARDARPEVSTPGADASTDVADRVDLVRAARVAARRWRCRVRAYVGTHHVSAELLALTRLLQWESVHTLRRPVGATTGPAFGHALDALGEALCTLQRAARDQVGEDFGGASCEIVLADAWLMYQVVPVDLAGLSPRLAGQAVAAALAEVAGAAAESLSVRWQRRRDGRAAFAMALPSDDLAAVRRAVTALRLRLAGVSGELVAIVNAHRGTVRCERGVVAVVREAGTQIAALVDGEVALAQYEIGVVDAALLPAVARRALSAHGFGVDAIDYCVDAAQRPETAPTVPPGAGRWHWLPAPAWAGPA